MRKTILTLLLLSADFAFGQQTASIPVTVNFPQIAVGGDTGEANYVTLLQAMSSTRWSSSDAVAKGMLCGNQNHPIKRRCCKPAPSVLEFDKDGNLLKSWGGPGTGL
jgi:hypothetical protein